MGSGIGWRCHHPGYVYDSLNRLTSLTNPQSQSFSFGGACPERSRRNPFGRRVQQSSSLSPLAQVNYLYDGANVLETLGNTGTPLAGFTPGVGVDEPLGMLASGAASYYESDGLGSVTSLTDQAGNLVNTYTYDSFGNPTSASGSVPNLFLYTGREFDLGTGVYYYRARYYDSNTGRFLSKTP